MKKRVVFLFALVATALASAGAAENRFDLEASGVHAEAGAGFAFILPTLHAELRYYPIPNVSVSGYAAAGFTAISVTLFGSTSETGLLVTNVGAESRAHLYLGSRFDLHAGAGVNLISFISDSVANMPTIYANTGVTLAVTNRIRIDAEANALYSLRSGADSRVAVLPVLRARFVF